MSDERYRERQQRVKERVAARVGIEPGKAITRFHAGKALHENTVNQLVQQHIEQHRRQQQNGIDNGLYAKQKSRKRRADREPERRHAKHNTERKYVDENRFLAIARSLSALAVCQP